MRTKQLGTYGEDLTVAYLLSCGYTVISRNFWCRFGEIDVIASDGIHIIFIEVKTRKNTDFDYPEEVLSNQKLLRMRRCSGVYLSQHLSYCMSPRLDLIYLLVDSQHMVQSLQHIKDIA